ncbi:MULTISPECIES: hypothetical protein [Mycobacteroides]|nr:MULTISPECIES: hypothetical protein [Mycobacteroides]
MAVVESLIHFASGLNRCFFDVLTAWFTLLPGVLRDVFAFGESASA